ncbi:MAG: VanZ family protein [Flavobacteriales bacterium]|nr:VanZ family protein [Flavobacteriales bacterium]MBL6872900.1 VanZ family protein [Flavobacteriales bacterium]
MRYTLAISWLVLIAILHAIPGDDISKFDFLDGLHIDKVVHATMFILAFVLLANAEKRQYEPPSFRYIIVGLVIYGFALEYSQGYFFENRSMDVFDWLADICGILIGLILFRKIPFLSSTTSCKKV